MLESEKKHKHRWKKHLCILASYFLIFFAGAVLGYYLIVIPHLSVLLPNLASQWTVYKSQAVVSDFKICSDIGIGILDQGGSAADAAITSILCSEVFSEFPCCGIVSKISGIAWNTTRQKMTSFSGANQILTLREIHRRSGVLPWSDLFKPLLDLSSEYQFRKSLNTTLSILAKEKMSNFFSDLRKDYLDMGYSVDNLSEKAGIRFGEPLKLILHENQSLFTNPSPFGGHSVASVLHSLIDRIKPNDSNDPFTYLEFIKASRIAFNGNNVTDEQVRSFHVSAADAMGNVVSLSSSNLKTSGVIGNRTGLLIGNFSDYYGNSASGIILKSNGTTSRVELVIGATGPRYQAISAVNWVAMRYFIFKEDIRKAVDKARISLKNSISEVAYEPGIDKWLSDWLKSNTDLKIHEVEDTVFPASVQAIQRLNNGSYLAVLDFRTHFKKSLLKLPQP